MKTPMLGASVEYVVEVVNPDGTARALPRRRNLILDQGLDGIAVRSWPSSIGFAAIGTGATPTKRDSGAVTFTRAGNTVTASAGFFEAADVGRLLKFDTGEEVRITAFASATSVTTATAGAIAAAEGTIWYVNQTGLTTETRRVGADQSSGSYAAGAMTYTRRYTFAEEISTVTIREIGWSHTGAAGANLFGRDLLAGAGVTLVAGQRLRVTMNLIVNIDIAARAQPNVITGGWGSDGNFKVESYSIDFGALSGHEAGNVLFGPGAPALGLAAWPGVGGLGPGEAEIGGTLLAYVPGEFKRQKQGVLPVGTAMANIRSIAFGSNGCSQMRFLMNAAHTKPDTHRLTVVFEVSWGRVLSNA